MRINVCFHGVGTPQRSLEPGESNYWITEGQFNRILDQIADTNDVGISFDDGNESDVTIGLDALAQRELRATFFLLAGRLGERGSIDIDGIRTLRDQGMGIGSHGMDHRPWRAMDASTHQRELVEARDRLSDVTGAPIQCAALPLGRYDRRLLHDLKQLGYRAVYTSDRRPARPEAWIQPRYSVRAGDTAETVRSQILVIPGLLRRAKLEGIGLIKQLR